MPISRRFLTAAGVAIATIMSGFAARAQGAAAAGVIVHLQSADPSVRIDMVMGDGTTSPVCSVPCRKALPRAALYVIRGDGMPATTRFLLPSDCLDLTLAVSPGSRTGRIAGMSLIAVGAAAMLVGFLLSPGELPDAPQDGTPRHTYGWAPIVGLAGIGVAAAGVGIWWNSETRVSSSTGRTFSQAPRVGRKRSAFALTVRGLEF